MIKEDSYHPALMISTDLESTKENAKIHYCYKKGNYGAFNNYLLNVNCIPLYQINKIDEMVEFLYGIIAEGMRNFIPRVKTHPTNYPVWFTNELKKNTKK